MTAPREFTTEDDGTYVGVPASEFPSGDDLDSSLIVDDGAATTDPADDEGEH